MRKILIAYLSILFSINIIYAQSYKPVDSLSSIKVVIKNVGMDTEGSLSGIYGAIVFNPADLKTALFSITIDAATINTGIEPRDITLQQAEYLDADKYPKIGFESRIATKLPGENRYMMRGVISIKGVSKEISFPFSAVPKDGGMLFTGEMKLNRRDYKIGMGSTVLSDGFSVFLAVFAKRSGNL